GEMVAVREFPVDATQGPQVTFERIAPEWDALASGRRIAAIGVALAGPAAPRRAGFVQAPRMAGGNAVPVGDLLEDRFGVRPWAARSTLSGAASCRPHGWPGGTTYPWAICSRNGSGYRPWWRTTPMRSHWESTTPAPRTASTRSPSRPAPPSAAA